MADETKIQWHPAFCSAVELTLLDNADSLDYMREFNLSSKPLQVDLLVINKNDGTRVEDEVGRIFKRHNLLEYKSPGDALNIDTWYKTIAYGCLYKALAGKHVNDAKIYSDGSKERELADSVLQVVVSANFDTFEILKKEDPIMCDALRELMKPEMDAALDNKTKDFAERMIKDGALPDEKIAQYSGLTLSQVKALREEMKTAVMA